MWAYASNPTGSALLLQFMALANQLPGLGTVIGEGGERVRQTLVQALSKKWADYGLADTDVTPAALLFLLVSNLVLLLVGCFMEALAALLILIPIMAPAAISFGIDPVQFGLIMIFNLILGTNHPPIGVVLFVMARIADVTFEQISRAILPWLVPLLIVLVAITVWPPLTLGLPALVMSK